MSILVTGGGGFLGSAVVRQLVARGATVRTFSRHRYDSLEQLGVDQHVGDLRDPSAVSRACQGIEQIHHTAAIAGIWGPEQSFHAINTLGTANLLAAAKRANCHQFIYTSSPSVTFDGKPQRGIDESAPYPRQWLCAYPKTKALAERAVLAADRPGELRTCALRPHLIWGVGDPHLIPRLIARARSGRLRRVGDGDNLIDMVYVENAAQAHLQAADELAATGLPGGKAYFITQGEPLRCWEWIDSILELAGLPPIQRSISLRAAYAVGGLFEALYGALRRRTEPPMTRFLALQLGTDHFFSIAAARRDFGYEPTVTTEQGMNRLGEWLSTHNRE